MRNPNMRSELFGPYALAGQGDCAKGPREAATGFARSETHARCQATSDGSSCKGSAKLDGERQSSPGPGSACCPRVWPDIGFGLAFGSLKWPSPLRSCNLYFKRQAVRFSRHRHLACMDSFYWVCCEARRPLLATLMLTWDMRVTGGKG